MTLADPVDETPETSAATPCPMTAAGIAADVRAGARSARDVVESALARLAEVEPSMGAFVLVDPDGARAAADAIDGRVRAGEAVGPLAGVPIAVKDVEDVLGWPTRMGSRVTSDQPVSADSPEIEALRRAGAVFIGKTTTGELGTSFTTQTPLHPDTANPNHLGCSAGGSSGGSAAAVASGIVPLATGTDAGGSIRVPASFCGVVGFKPSRGATAGSPRDRAGLVEPGVLTTTPADARRWFDVVGTGGPLHSTPATRIAFVAELGGAPVDREIAAITARAAGRVVTVDAAAVPGLNGLCLDDLGMAEWAVAAGGELSEDLRRAGIWPDRADELGDDLRRRLDSLAGLSPMDLVWAQAVRGALVARARQVFESIDALLTPTTAVFAPPRGGPFPPVIGGRDGSASGPAPFCAWANMWGSPAVSVPVGRSTDGLPVGLQILGPPGADRALLDLAAVIMSQDPGT